MPSKQFSPHFNSSLILTPFVLSFFLILFIDVKVEAVVGPRQLEESKNEDAGNDSVSFDIKAEEQSAAAAVAATLKVMDLNGECT